MTASDQSERGVRWTQAGLLINTVLAVIKLVAGIVGSTYALIADAVESTADIFSSLIVWSGLRIASRDPDERYPFGYGKAEPLAAAIVGLMLVGAAIGIAVEAIREIRTPHHTPAPWTLAVLTGVIIIKEVLFRRVLRVGDELGSSAVQADALHHRSDAITSAAAFIGISIALWGGPGWESADDWAALLASGVILFNGTKILRPAVNDLMDRMPGEELIAAISRAAATTSGVCATEKLKVRRVGTGYYVDIHVQADAGMSLHEAHVLSGRVKGSIRQAVPGVLGVLIHMEPHEPGS
jgi:cation diffusion facilitator family transporter